MLKSKIAGLSILCSALFSLPASAAYTQVIDDFESGTLGSRWSVVAGVYPADVDVYNAISSYHDNGEGPELYYSPQGSWMAVLRAGEPFTAISTYFTTFAEGVLEMQVFFSANEALPSDDVGMVLISSSDGPLYDDVYDDVLFWGQTDTTGIGYGRDNTGWLNISAPLPAGNHSLLFAVANGEDDDFTIDAQLAVDNIRVTYAVPEPSIYAMVLSALGLVGFAAYRRRAGLSRIEG